jgi:hypothetical protein
MRRGARHRPGSVRAGRPRRLLASLTLLTVTLAVAVLLVHACAPPRAAPGRNGASAARGSASAPAAPGLPARPVTLRLDTVNPCALITPAQQAELGTRAGEPAELLAHPGRFDCLWANPAVGVDHRWLAIPVLERGVEHYLADGPVQMVGGFASVRTDVTPGGCELFIDVAPGQALEVEYLASARRNPAMDPKVACQRATAAAEMMIATLRTLPPG